MISHHMIMKRRDVSLIICMAICFCLIRTYTFAKPVLIDSILAVVNGEIITYSDLVIREKRVLGKNYASKDITTDARESIRERILQDLIDERLMIEEAERIKISPTEEEVENHLDQIKRENGFESDEAFDAALSKDGLTRQDLEKNIHEDLSLLRIHQRVLHQPVQVTDREIEEYYDQEWTGNQEGTRVEISHIFLGDHPITEIEQKAKKIFQAWEEGQSFAQLVSQYAEDPSQKEGGYLGWFYEKDLRPEFAEAIKGIPPGDMAGPVKTDAGHHILFLSERKNMGLEKGSPIWEKIKETLIERKKADNYETWMERLRRKATIEVHKKALIRNE